jgi:hypothetical protein
MVTAYDHGRDLIQNGAWQSASGVVERFQFQRFVDRFRAERLL